MPGILVNQPDNEGYTPLFCAAGEGLNDVLQLLLAHPEIEHNTTVTGETPLSMAATNGHEVAAKLLSSASKTDINLRRGADGATAFTMACDCGHDEIVRCLLAHPSIDINIVNEGRSAKNEGECALFVAAEMGHEHIVELLLRRPEIIIDQPRLRDGMTPLSIASQKGFSKVVKMLQAYINAKAAGDAGVDAQMAGSKCNSQREGGLSCKRKRKPNCERK